jgi:hypothetical protein
MGAEEYEDDETEAMPIDCQFLDEDKVRCPQTRAQGED